MNAVFKIQEPNLFDYSLKLQEAVEKGYRIGDSVDDSPMVIGWTYCATLTKQNVEEVCNVYQDEGVAEVSDTSTQEVIPNKLPVRRTKRS